MINSKKLYVLKSNRIIEAQYKLSAREQKFILYMASKIKQDDTEFEFYEVKVSEIASILNISGKKQGNIHQEIYEMCQNFNKKPIRIEGPNGRMQMINWVSSADFQPESGIITFEFSKRLRPLLLNLKAHFTRYSLEFVMQLSSSYSIRFYELLKRHHFKKPPKFSITVDELKKILDIQDSYKEYRYFKKRVLKVAQTELDEKADIGFTYKEHRVKRRVTSLTFLIHSNKSSESEVIEHGLELDQARVENTIAPDHPVVKRLIQIGFKYEEAKKLFEKGFMVITDVEAREKAKKDFTQPEAYFISKIEMLEKEQLQQPKHNPVGFLVKALSSDYRNEKEEQDRNRKVRQAQRTAKHKKLKASITSLQKEIEDITAVLDMEEAQQVAALLKSEPQLLAQVAKQGNIKEYFLYDSSLSLEENYQQKHSIQSMVHAILREQYSQQILNTRLADRERLQSLNKELSIAERELKRL